MDLSETPVADLKPYKQNARTHSPEQVRQIVKSIEQFGFTNPVLTDGKNRIVAGHGRVMAAKEMGLPTVPTIPLSHLTKAQVRAYVIADNKLALNAGWDEQILAEELKGIDDSEIDIDLTGFSEDEIAEMLKEEPTGSSEEDDNVPDTPQNIFNVQRGQIWQLGDHRLMCGDSTDKGDVDRLMDGDKPVFSFTSPPYVDMRDYGGADLTLEKIVQFIDSRHCDFYAVNLGLSRKDGVVNRYWDAYIDRADEQWLGLTAWNVWSREGRGGSLANMSAMFPVEHEWVFVFGGNKDRVNRTKKNKTAGLHTNISHRQKDGSTKKREPQIVQEYGRMGSVTNCCYATGTGKIGHPAMFPVELAEKYIEACSNKSDWIYEPFCGSGSTLIACEKTGRKCYGMEIDPHYCSVIINRWQEFTGNTAEPVDGS